ncbi:ABC transporter permease [Pseudaestuariivita sp.]|uniref:ABC transporter permease n=1 Tax=Pseudaestuariivita sp. TaxID=2211669 RepID=UPI004059F9B7
MPDRSDLLPRTDRARAAWLVLLVAAVCILAEPFAPWLISWPTALTLPLTDWVGTGAEAVLNFIKPAARGVSWLLDFPMSWLQTLLSALPWPMVIGAVAALGWHLGGWRLAALGALGLGFVVASGYWSEGMNTLALVFVSVPLALALGLAIGLAAYELPRLKAPIQATLDAMQTVPTFAYLTPLLLLFGFGPVVGLIASAIYAAPPMARNVLLALERIDPEIKEAAIMSGGTRRQQLFQVELPAGLRQIMVGVNQSLMAALSMVIIAAVIGGFDDIGWEVLLTMRKALFGQAFLAGLVVVIFAVIIDRYSGTLTSEPARHDPRVAYTLLVLGAVGAVVFWNADPSQYTLFDTSAEAVDSAVSAFTASYGTTLDTVKNTAMFYGLLPLRIGLDQAVLPFTWGFVWTAAMSWTLYAAALGLAGLLWWSGRGGMALAVVLGGLVLETGIANLPWPLVLVGIGAATFTAVGGRFTLVALLLVLSIFVAGLGERALLSLYLCSAAVVACALLGGLLGWLGAVSTVAWTILRPVCDMLQTIPLFVFLIPVLMFFQIGEFSAFLAIIAYAIVPMIRYTREGLTQTPSELLDAAVASGATPWQTMRDVRAPYAIPTILLGLNQTILYAFAMLVIAALIGTTGLGQSIYLALGQADVGLGLSAGAAMAILAFVADRIVQGLARARKEALGL